MVGSGYPSATQLKIAFSLWLTVPYRGLVVMTGGAIKVQIEISDSYDNR